MILGSLNWLSTVSISAIGDLTGYAHILQLRMSGQMD